MRGAVCAFDVGPSFFALCCACLQLSDGLAVGRNASAQARGLASVPPHCGGPWRCSGCCLWLSMVTLRSRSPVFSAFVLCIWRVSCLLACRLQPLGLWLTQLAPSPLGSQGWRCGCWRLPAHRPLSPTASTLTTSGARPPTTGSASSRVWKERERRRKRKMEEEEEEWKKRKKEEEEEWKKNGRRVSLTCFSFLLSSFLAERLARETARQTASQLRPYSGRADDMEAREHYWQQQVSSESKKKSKNKPKKQQKPEREGRERERK